jgi:2-polyprenyl-3-methyl-5-hydroxy-6-metoxy-1,4-benzoquinol methylase
MNICLTNKLRNNKTIPVMWCADCELGHLNDNKTEEEICKYYNEDYRKEFKPNLNNSTNAQELFDTHVNHQNDRLRLLDHYLNNRVNLLEIGCSAGMFIYHIKKKVDKVIGIELDKLSAEYTQTMNNVKVYQNNIERTDISKNSQNIICGFQVLEHVYNPLKFLHQLKQYLTKDGIICFEVPNTYDVLAYYYDLPNHFNFYFHEAHRFYFTQKSLRILLNKCDFNILQVEYLQDYNILNHFNWILNDKPQNGPSGLNGPILNFKNQNQNISNSLNDFLIKIDNEYKNILKHYGITSNIAIIGKQK